MSRPITQGVSCEVCNLQRAPGEIHPRESRLLKGTTLLICNKCEAGKKEPRSFIIIVARTRGFEAVADYIKFERYVGKTIEAKEIIK
jgi:hypothetical protein